MAVCEVCGNDYDKAFAVVAAAYRNVFDCFECAIQKLAPICQRCGCRVVGHGVEISGRFDCCATAPGRPRAAPRFATEWTRPIGLAEGTHGPMRTRRQVMIGASAAGSAPRPPRARPASPA